MNIVLFEPNEISSPLSRKDPRALHILEVLRRKNGDTFDAGLYDGPRGKATLVHVGEAFLDLKFSWGDPPPALPPFIFLIGMPRPQTARKILQEATAMGVAEFEFVLTDRSEPSYANSSLWTSGEWRRHLQEGAAQAFCTRIPTLSHGATLTASLENMPAGGTRIALDNYEAPESLTQTLVSAGTPKALPLFLAVGSERGWSANERTLLRSQGFALAHLGTRVLRTETAVVAAVAVIKSNLGWL